MTIVTRGGDTRADIVTPAYLLFIENRGCGEVVVSTFLLKRFNVDVEGLRVPPSSHPLASRQLQQLATCRDAEVIKVTQ